MLRKHHLTTLIATSAQRDLCRLFLGLNARFEIELHDVVSALARLLTCPVRGGAWEVQCTLRGTVASRFCGSLSLNTEVKSVQHRSLPLIAAEILVPAAVLGEFAKSMCTVLNRFCSLDLGLSDAQKVVSCFCSPLTLLVSSPTPVCLQNSSTLHAFDPLLLALRTNRTLVEFSSSTQRLTPQQIESCVPPNRTLCNLSSAMLAMQTNRVRLSRLLALRFQLVHSFLFSRLGLALELGTHRSDSSVCSCSRTDQPCAARFNPSSAQHYLCLLSCPAGPAVGSNGS